MYMQEKTPCPQCTRAKANRRIARAYLVCGGATTERQQRVERLDDGAYFMNRHYTNPEDTEIAFIASEKHESFYGMTFDEAKALAGNNQLPTTFTGPAWCDFKSPTRGIIQLQ